MPLAKRVFVGRKNEIEQFTQAMRPAVPTQPSLTNPGQGVRSRLFLPFGIGGIGKSELTKKCLELARLANWKTLLLDWDRVDNRVVEPLGLMDRLAETLKGMGGEAAIKHYMDERKRVGGLQEQAQRYRTEHPEEWQKILDAIDKVADLNPEPITKWSLSVLRGTLDMGPKQLAKLADLMVRRKKLSTDEATLLTQPGVGLARKLVSCIVDVAKTQSLGLALDTCEVLSPELEEFLRDLIVCPAIEQSTGLLVIVSGRHNQNNARQVEADKGHKRRLKGYADRLADSPPIVWTLSQFAEPEIADYLRENELQPTDDLIAYVQGTAHGVPFAVQLLVEALRALGEEKVRKDFPPDPGDVNLPEMVRQVVSRFLQYCLDDPTDELRVRALAMLTGRDDGALRAMCQLPQADTVQLVLDGLRARYGFIQSDGRLHDEVRSFLRQDLCDDNHETARQLGALAADYYVAEWEQETASFATLEERLNEKRWQQLTLATANALCWHDEQMTIPFLVMRGLEGLEFNYAFAQGLLEQALEFRETDDWWHHRACRHFDNLARAVIGSDEEEMKGLEALLKDKDDIQLDETAECILHLWRARNLLKQEKALEALAACEAAETKVPEDAGIRRKLARVFAEVGWVLGFRQSLAIKSKDAIHAYERVAFWDSSTSFYHSNLAALLSETGDYLNAQKHCDLAIELDPQNMRAYNNRGSAYDDLKQYEQALVDYTKAIELDPQHAKAYNNRGIAYYGLKQYEAALTDYTQAIDLDSHYSSPVYNTACAYALWGKLPEACGWLRRAIDMDKKYLEDCRTYSDFDAIRETDEFKALLAEFEREK